MLNESEIKARRDMERNRIIDLVRTDQIHDTRLIVETLTWVLEDD